MIVVPVNLPQVELRRGNYITVASFILGSGQELEMRNLSLSILKQLSVSPTPKSLNSDLGNCYVGLFDNRCYSSPISIVSSDSGSGVFGMDPYNRVRIVSKGVYKLVAVNNTGLTYDTSVDYSVSVTASFVVFL